MLSNELEKANFDGATLGHVLALVHLHVGVAVKNDGLLEVIEDVLSNFDSVSGVCGALSMHNFDNHLAFGERSSLSSDDFMELACGLKRIQVFDKKVLIS